MRWFFDFLIIGFLIVDALLLITLTHQFLHFIRARKPLWRIVVTSVLLVIIALAGTLVFYGSFIEPNRVVLHYETLELRPNPTHSLRIGLISDLHASSYLTHSEIWRVIAKLQEPDPRPDVILMAGDFVSGNNAAAARLEDLGHLGPPLGTYGVLGNHDYGENADALITILEQAGISILRNEYTVIEKDGGKIAIVGADDVWFGTTDLDRATAGISEGVPKILVAHNPDIVYALGDHHFDAILAAHTHGGQIRLPWIGAIPPIPTSLGKAYDRGVFDWQGTPLVITQGIGETGPRARLFAPPEVMIIDVKF